MVLHGLIGSNRSYPLGHRHGHCKPFATCLGLQVPPSHFVTGKNEFQKVYKLFKGTSSQTLKFDFNAKYYTVVHKDTIWYHSITAICKRRVLSIVFHKKYRFQAKFQHPTQLAFNLILLALKSVEANRKGRKSKGKSGDVAQNATAS